LAEQLFEINVPDVLHEVIDGEAIMINMTTGSYYSLEAVGGLVWELLQQGAASAGTLTTALLPAVTGEAATIQGDIGELLNEMLAEGLVRPAGAGAALQPVNRDAQPFKRPVLKKYNDLENLLLIDPIHDVTPEGWPQAKNGKNKSTASDEEPG